MHRNSGQRSFELLQINVLEPVLLLTPVILLPRLQSASLMLLLLLPPALCQSLGHVPTFLPALLPGPDD